MELIENNIYVDKEKLKNSSDRNGYTLKELKEYCKLLKLKTSGKKWELSHRIIEYKQRLIMKEVVDTFYTTFG